MPKVLVKNRIINHHFWERREEYQRANPFIGMVAIEMTSSQILSAKNCSISIVIIIKNKIRNTGSTGT